MSKINEIIDLQTKPLRDFIGNKVLEARERLKLTQEELSRKAKVSLTTINRLEKGKQLPHDGNLKEILKQLKIQDVTEGFTEDQSRKNNPEAHSISFAASILEKISEMPPDYRAFVLSVIFDDPKYIEEIPDSNHFREVLEALGKVP